MRITALFLLLAAYTLPAWAQWQVTLIGPPGNESRGTSRSAQVGWVIYDGLTGSMVAGLPVHFELTGLGGPRIVLDCVPDANGLYANETCGNGGHTHDTPPRPLIFNNGSVDYPGDTDPSPTRVEGVTQGTLRGAIWQLPQAGGNYGFISFVTARPGTFFFPFRTLLTLEGTVDVTAVRGGLRQLPARADHLYEKVRTPETNHKDDVAFAADELTNLVVPWIALEYFVNSGRTLSVNDISLPKGGVFDVGLDWHADHIEHREGRDVDINHSGVRCDQDLVLRQVVDMFLEGLPASPPGPPVESAFLCEGKTGNKHIDVTTLLPFEPPP